MIFILDTNICTLLIKNPHALDHRQSALAEDDKICTTMISFGESVGGWLSKCRRAKNGGERSEACTNLYETFTFYRRSVCLPFDGAAAAIFDQLRTQKLRVGTNDLAIASIAFSVNAVLITRNTVDFERVPNLVIEDWTK